MTCRILAVEDSATQAEALRALLEEEGYDVSVARSADVALEKLATTEFDLVLSDVVMPGITGYELCHRIKHDPKLAKLPVVLLTSLIDPMDIIRGLECGADNYITKPYDPQHLLARVRHVLDNRRLRRDAKTSLGVTVRFLGRDLTINSEREQILDLFISSVEDVVRTNEALQESQRELASAHSQLEEYAREKAREARTSTERYRVLLQSAGDAIFVLDEGSRVLELNRRAADLLARPMEEVIGRSLLDLLGTEEGDDLPSRLASLEPGGQLLLAERRFVDRKGNETWCEITASRTALDGEGLVLLIARDVTERRRAEEELRRRERQLTEAHHLAHLGSWEWSIPTDEVIWSDEVYGIVGIDPTQRITRGWFIESVHPDDRELVHSATESALRAGEGFSIEYRLRRPDGSERYIHSRATVELDPDGRPQRLAGTMQDLTERKDAERARLEREEAEQANRAKSEFLSRMSHELRTPLNAILGFAQLLEMAGLEPADQESLEQILSGGRHLLQLINEVLDLSRIEAGKLSLSVEPVSVREVIDDAVSLLHPLAEQRHITVRAEMDDVVDGFVLADLQRLKQVILNFVANALKYGDAGGSVRVFTSKTAQGRLRVSVRDTGPGIAPEELDKLFVAFERLGAEAKGVEGTGLGLVLAKRLAQAMGGEVGVTSELGKGSTFWIELPTAGTLAEAPALPAEVASEGPRGQHTAITGTVLYVEDNPSNLRLAERILARSPGVRLLTAMQGSLGLDMAREFHPDLVLLDMNLPDMSGEEVLRHFRSDPALRQTPVVVVSGDAMPAHAERLLGAGAEHYLTKPFDVQRFLAIVESILERERR